MNSRLDGLADQEINGLLAPENRRDIYRLFNAVIGDLLGSYNFV